MARVAITSARLHRVKPLIDELVKAGHEVIYTPILSLKEVSSNVEEFIRGVEECGVAMFLTGQSVASLVNSAKSAGLLDRLRDALSRAEIICRGSKAAGNVKSLLGLNCGKVFERVEQAIDHVRGRKCVAASIHATADEDVEGALSSAVEKPVVVRTYEADATEYVKQLINAVTSREVDVVVFTSAAAVSTLMEQLDEETRRRVVEAFNNRVAVASIGPVTSEELRRWGIAPAIEPEKPFVAFLAKAILQFLDRRKTV